ncbi:MAG: potassium-transporting ATPase subunit KdpA [Chloroflexi bacterium]|nr:MAG: potassium-transporting ATPase subunit KdpA [Chloroflexota bacterium]
MTTQAILQLVLYVAALALLAKLLGGYLARVFSGERTFADPVLAPVERTIYRLTGVDPQREMPWTTYAFALLAFSLFSVLALYLLQRVQGSLPLNPAGQGNVPPHLAFNTAVSFTTNTNWQSYLPEATVSHLTQMAGLTVQNFVSAAAGIAIAVALVRGLARHSAKAIGNFWVDLTRAVLWVLLPVAFVLALIFVSQGVVQNLDAPRQITTLPGEVQTIAQGPVASQEAIKMFGTNGGGFFNANSAHPFENPTPLTNLLQMLTIFAIPAGLTAMFGRMVGNPRQGWTVFGVMLALFLVGAVLTTVFEQQGNPRFPDAVDQRASASQAGGNMEGKETRFGISASALFATITTAASCGAVNAMHDAFTPLGGLVLLNNIAVGEVIFGGVGAGLYGFLIFAMLAVFIAGLMVGRTPEYIGKKIEPREMTFVTLTILVVPLLILGLTAIALVTERGLLGPLNPGPHGLTEVLYAYTSGAGNNGSAFAGLNANSNFYATTLGIAMLGGRFLMIVPILAVAGSLAAKKRVAATAGTFPTTGLLFGGLLCGVILIVAALTFFPAYALGPIVEHLMLRAGS